MANREGHEDEPGLGQRGRGRDQERDPERRSGERPGGGYGLGGAERGYNQGGYGGMGSHEEGYAHGSYDRKLDATERSRGKDERTWLGRTWGPKSESNPGLRGLFGGSGVGREAFAEEWRNFERLRAERDRQAAGGRETFREERREDLPGSRWEHLRGRSQEWMARSPGLGKAPKGYTRSDERIREDICERLMNSPYDASEVEVLVTRGEVTLVGTVRSREEKWGIEDVAETVLGVQEVHNQIRLDRTEADSLGDTDQLHS